MEEYSRLPPPQINKHNNNNSYASIHIVNYSASSSFFLIEIFPIFDRKRREKKLERTKATRILSVHRIILLLPSVPLLFILVYYQSRYISPSSSFFFLLRLLLLPHTRIHLMRKTTSLLNCPQYLTSLVAYEISNSPRSTLIYVKSPIE